MKRLILTILPLPFIIVACTASQDLGDRPGETVDTPDTAPSSQPDPGTPDAHLDTAPAADAAPGEEPVSPEAPTYFTSNLGFIARDAYSYDRYSPSGVRQVRGIMITSFLGACDKAKGDPGTKTMDIVFSGAVDAIPAVGTYPLSDGWVDTVPMAIAYGITNIGPGCSAQSFDGGHFVSGQVVITRSDATGLEGTLEGALVGVGPTAVNVTGHFVAPRCTNLGGGCSNF